MISKPATATTTTTTPQRLADQESNWRRPRSPALAIPGAAVTAAPHHSNSNYFSKSTGAHGYNNGSGSAAGPWAHFRRANNYQHKAGGDSAAAAAVAASYDGGRDAATAANWRTQQQQHGGGSEGSNGTTSKGLAVGGLPQPHHRKHHVGFVASSNAAEVARRAFVASEIGSIGKTAGGAASGQGKRQQSPDREKGSALQPAVPLRPLYVTGFEPMAKEHKAKPEDWAATPTSTLPSLPTSPVAQQSRDSQQSSVLQRRLESHDALIGNRNGSPSGLVRMPARALLNGNSSNDGVGGVNGSVSSPLNPAVIRAGGGGGGGGGAAVPPSPKKTPLSSFNGNDDSSSSRPSFTLNNTTTSSPRRPTENLGRFRTSVDSPQPQRNGSPALLGPTRKDSYTSLSSTTSGHPLSHSRRDSTASNFSSPSATAASIISSRPAYGVYRPPHLRNRNSNNGLQKNAVSHYDRVRTPSLRGYLRSPEPPSRPGSAQLMASGDRLGPDWSPRLPSAAEVAGATAMAAGLDSPVHLDAPAPWRSHGHKFSASSLREEPTPAENDEEEVVERLHDSPSGRSSATTRSFAPPSEFGWDEEEVNNDDEDDVNLTHSAMLLHRTSLTDSYCLSRRTSYLSTATSAFRIGAGNGPVVDIFSVGDRLGPGMLHDGLPITIAETSEGFKGQMRDVTGTRLEVVRKLGEGSYAVVYLVKEVQGDDGQVHVGPKEDGESERMRLMGERGKPIAGASGGSGVGEDTEGDLTLADTTLLPAGTTLTDKEGLLSSTLKARKPGGDSFATRLSAEAAAAAAAAAGAQDGAMAIATKDSTATSATTPTATAEIDDPLLPGITQPHEGRLFALKCLCKRDLSDEMLEVQRLEATIHQSLPPHANIVTLYRTYETAEWLFLVLEYCPGQDLYYWLEGARDTTGEDLASTLGSPSVSGTSTPLSADGDEGGDGTPPSPSLLASTAGNALLSRRRLKLISKMFRQMCEAVQFCHDRGVAHRDIKPENFIVEDRRGVRDEDEEGGEGEEDDEDVESIATTTDLDESEHQRDRLSAHGSSTADRRPSRHPSSRRRVSTVSVSTTRSVDTTATALLSTTSRVVVKLTDFGLAVGGNSTSTTTSSSSSAEQDTHDPASHCIDFDCGSKPYMAYECRNNVTSYYDAKQADVWSLGIVLLNLIWHRNPFREPNMERCESFTAYCYDPIGFLMEGFEGMTRGMAEWLSNRVLCNVVPRPGADADADAEATTNGDGNGNAHAHSNGEIAPLKRRVSAREFGEWARDLPLRFGLRTGETHKVLKRGGASVVHTSPMAHSRQGSESSTLPSMLSSPRGFVMPREREYGGGQGGGGGGLVVDEDDDKGLSGRALFPEYEGRSGGEREGGRPGPVRSSTNYQHRSASLVGTPDLLPSPTFPPSSPRLAHPHPHPHSRSNGASASPSPLPKGAQQPQALSPPRVIVDGGDESIDSAHLQQQQQQQQHHHQPDREKMSTLARMLESARWGGKTSSSSGGGGGGGSDSGAASGGTTPNRAPSWRGKAAGGGEKGRGGERRE